MEINSNSHIIHSVAYGEQCIQIQKEHSEMHQYLFVGISG